MASMAGHPNQNCPPQLWTPKKIISPLSKAITISLQGAAEGLVEHSCAEQMCAKASSWAQDSQYRWCGWSWASAAKEMLLWKGRFPSMPSLIILEVDGAPHQDGSRGTSVCHRVIFHPKLCCFHSWSCKGRSRERGGKASTALPLSLRVFCGSRAPGRRGSLSPGRGLRLPAVREGHRAPQPPKTSRDTDFGRLFPRQRSLASRSPCCLSQRITHDLNRTHRTISVPRCFSRQR